MKKGRDTYNDISPVKNKDTVGLEGVREKEKGKGKRGKENLKMPVAQGRSGDLAILSEYNSSVRSEI